jgi:predicted DNA-binding transcriptional regulator YafY
MPLRPRSSVPVAAGARRAGPALPGHSPNRPALARMLEIHQVLCQGAAPGQRLNCATLAARLGFSAKTVHRDLTYMRDQLGLPVEYDAQEKSYSYPGPDVPFPAGHNLSQEERIALSVARQALAVFRGVDFADQLASAHDKLFGGLLTEHGLSLEGDLGEYLSVRTPGAGVADRKVFKAVVTALLQRRELRARYQTKGQPAPTPRRLAPYHLACVDARWVLVARDLEKDAVQTYILARLSEPRIAAEAITRPVKFDVASHLGTSFGVWTGRGEIVVRLRLNADAAHHVRERHWHATQQVTERPAGEAEVSFRLSDLHDVTRWVLGFGGDCLVVEPPELRAAVVAEARAMMDGSRFRGA